VIEARAKGGAAGRVVGGQVTGAVVVGSVGVVAVVVVVVDAGTRRTGTAALPGPDAPCRPQAVSVKMNERAVKAHRLRIVDPDPTGPPLASGSVTTVTRHHVKSGSPFEDIFGYSRAVRVGERCLVSGTAPIWPDGSCPDDVRVQAQRCFEIIGVALAELGASLDDVVRTRMYVVDPADADIIGRTHAEAVGRARPVTTMVVVAGLIDPSWRVEIEAEAIVSEIVSDT
jgi:enamine deaminase RidA (YjgF/YER057c/UK114 family)